MGGSTPGTGEVTQAGLPDIARAAAGGPFASSQNPLRQALLNSVGMPLGATPNMPTSFNLPGLNLSPMQAAQTAQQLQSAAAIQQAARNMWLDPRSRMYAFGYGGAPGGSPGGAGIGSGSSGSGAVGGGSSSGAGGPS